MMTSFRFTFGGYQELHNSKYNGISLEALLYDAIKGINLSIVDLMYFYFTYEERCLKKEPEVFLPIQKFMLTKLEDLIYQEIEPEEILTPYGGKPHKKFYPTKLNNGRIDMLGHIESIREWTKDSHNKAFNNYVAVNEKAPSISTLENDKKFLQTRQERLSQVEKLLKTFYREVKKPDDPSSADKFIDQKHKCTECQKAFSQLEELYKYPRNLS